MIYSLLSTISYLSPQRGRFWSECRDSLHSDSQKESESRSCRRRAGGKQLSTGQLHLDGFESLTTAIKNKDTREGYPYFLAEDEGFEPPQTESESGVLPLHKSSICDMRFEQDNHLQIHLYFGSIRKPGSREWFPGLVFCN